MGFKVGRNDRISNYSGYQVPVNSESLIKVVAKAYKDIFLDSNFLTSRSDAEIQEYLSDKKRKLNVSPMTVTDVECIDLLGILDAQTGEQFRSRLLNSPFCGFITQTFRSESPRMSDVLLEELQRYNSIPLKNFPSKLQEDIRKCLEQKFQIRLGTISDMMKKDLFLPVLSNILERVRKHSWTINDTQFLAILTQKLIELYDDSSLPIESSWISREVLKKVNDFFCLFTDSQFTSNHSLSILKSPENALLNLQFLTGDRRVLEFVRAKIVNSPLSKSDLEYSKRIMSLLFGVYDPDKAKELLGDGFFYCLQKQSIILDVIELAQSIKTGQSCDLECINEIGKRAATSLLEDEKSERTILDEYIIEVSKIFKDVSKDELLENLYTSNYFLTFFPGAKKEDRVLWLREIGSRKAPAEAISYTWDLIRRGENSIGSLSMIRRSIADELDISDFSSEEKSQVQYIFNAETRDDLFEKMYSSPLFHQISLREDELSRFTALVRICMKKQEGKNEISLGLLEAISKSLKSLPTTYLREIDAQIDKELVKLNQSQPLARVKISNLQSLKRALRGAPIELVDWNLVYGNLVKIKSFYFRKGLFYI